MVVSDGGGVRKQEKSDKAIRNHARLVVLIIYTESSINPLPAKDSIILSVQFASRNSLEDRFK